MSSSFTTIYKNTLSLSTKKGDPIGSPFLFSKVDSAALESGR